MEQHLGGTGDGGDSSVQQDLCKHEVTEKHYPDCFLTSSLGS